jgi:2-oxoisovalerate dehydrogenase E1 component
MATHRADDSLTTDVAHRLYRGCLIRAVEEELLRLFAAGKVGGTTHTCIGQEMAAITLADSLDRNRDFVVSNHRCHGHYLAWTDDVEGLIAEVLGKRTGVCGGIGGSQHLCGRRFFSNGVQGGIVPVAAGLAFAQKLEGRGAIVAVCIGDGTLGEGVTYETFNIAVKWRLPLLVLLENNLYAQSTSQHETLAGDIDARAAAFGMRTFRGDTWNHSSLAQEMRSAADFVRESSAPAFVRVDTYRLAAHSKGDDDRDPVEIEFYSCRDPINIFRRTRRVANDPRLIEIRKRVAAAIDRAERDVASEWPAPAVAPCGAPAPVAVSSVAAENQLEAINRALRAWMIEDQSLLILGEDIRSPYGGAFKVTRGLSDAFPDRVLNTPISEAAIVGIGNGLGLGGRRAIVEIMFGDFLTLCCDQIVNHAAKFHGMYNRRVGKPIVIRTPMGGGRGYGPTHSQNLEKHFAGIPGLAVAILHGRTRVADVYRTVRSLEEPLLLVENKLLYREHGDAPLPEGYARYEIGDALPTTMLRTDEPADLTIVAFGRMSVLAERVLGRLTAEEIAAELLLPLLVSPFDAAAIVDSVARTGKLLVVEEGTAGFDLASEVIASVSVRYRGERALRVRRVAAQPVSIPSAPELEQHVLPAEADLFENCLELFDE